MTAALTVALTGATGFIGAAVARALLNDGRAVRALARRLPPAPEPEVRPIEIVPGDLSDTVALARLCERADIVIHCAGAVLARDRAAFFAVNADGTARLAAAAGRAGVRRFVHVSSLAARAPELSDYAASKAAAETALRAAPASSSAPIERVIIRPPAVYGPGDAQTAKLFRLARFGALPAAGGAQARFSAIYIEDLARLIAACAVAPLPDGDAPLEPDDGAKGGHGWRAFGNALGVTLGRPVRPVRPPRALLGAAAHLNAAIAGACGRATIFTPGKLRELSWPDWTVSAEGARRAVAVDAARVPLAEGLRRTLHAPHSGA